MAADITSISTQNRRAPSKQNKRRATVKRPLRQRLKRFLTVMEFASDRRRQLTGGGGCGSGRSTCQHFECQPLICSCDLPAAHAPAVSPLASTGRPPASSSANVRERHSAATRQLPRRVEVERPPVELQTPLSVSCVVVR
jgi:hypothetical protein